MAPTAAAAILCGDPARALLLAQELLSEPRMSNHHRGLWGYWGTTPDGAELTVQATGIGGPSATVVFNELIEAGVERAVRIGSCSSPDGSLALGSTVVAATAALAGGAPIATDRSLTAALVEAGAGAGAELVSLALPHIPGEPPDPEVAGRKGAAGGPFDLQTAALAELAGSRGVRFAAALIVAESDGVPLLDDALEAAAIRLGRIAAPLLADQSNDRPSTSGRG